MSAHDFFDRDDELQHCKVCGGAEGSLPTLCPGRRMTEEEQDAVYAGELDFNMGSTYEAEWWTPVRSADTTPAEPAVAV
jgi:hypothetical protein